MLFITSHTQQAVNAAAADSARGRRQWAKEACQGSAGAGHAFTKIGIDDGEHCGLAGLELLVKCCHHLHSKRSTMSANHTTALLAWDTTPRLFSIELRVRFIDLLMAFVAKLVKPLCWTHMMVLRPELSGEHRAVGLMVAQKWDDADAKLTLATLLETVATGLPTCRLWNVVDDISGHVAGTPKMVQVLTAEAARLLVDALQARHSPLSKGKRPGFLWKASKGKSKGRHGQAQAGSFAAVGGARHRRVRHGTQRLGPTCSWASDDEPASSGSA